MRKSRMEFLTAHVEIVDKAASLFRGRGIDALGVADLMAANGRTVGGFYKHFPSKDALVAEACEAAVAGSLGRLTEVVERAPAGRGLEALVKAYLSLEHCQHPEDGCALAALAPEVARRDAETKQPLADGYWGFVALIEKQLKGKGARRRAMAIMTSMIGALSVARLMPDRASAEEVLAAARGEILAAN